MIVRDLLGCVTNTSGTGNLQINGELVGMRPIQSHIDPGATNPFVVRVKDGDASEVFETYIIDNTPKELFRGRLISSTAIDGSRLNLSNAANKPIYQVEPAEMFGPMGGRSRFAVTTGTAPDYVASFPVPIVDLKNGTRCTVRFHAVNPNANNTFTADETTSKPLKFGRPLRKIGPGKILLNLIGDLEFSESDDAWIVVSALPTGIIKQVTGTTYTVLEEDHEMLLVFTHASGCAVTVPQATGQFAAPFRIRYWALGGAITFTPTTSTINGAASISVGSGSGVGEIFADGGNYRAPSAVVLNAAVDNIFVNSLLSLISGGLSRHLLIDGMADAFTDQTGVDVAGSTNVSYAAAGRYYTNRAVPTTNYGNTGGQGNRTASITVTANFSFDSGALSNLVDGTTSGSQNDEPGTGSTAVAGARIIVDFGSGNLKYIDELSIDRSSGAGNSGMWRVEVGASSSGPWTTVSPADFAMNGTTVTVPGLTPDAAGHRYYSLLGVSGNWSNSFMNELRFKINAGGAIADTVLKSNGYTAAATPSSAALVVLHQPVVAVTLNTDLILSASRDGGTTWTAATLVNRGAFDSTYNILTANVDLSSQPAGTSVKWKAETVNAKEQRLKGISERWAA